MIFILINQVMNENRFFEEVQLKIREAKFIYGVK